jgi:hypothetical protein
MSGVQCLNNGREALVDDADLDRVSAFKWYSRSRRARGGNYTLPIRNDWSTGKKREIPMSHEVMGRPEKGFVIDHINGDPFDNAVPI